MGLEEKTRIAPTIAMTVGAIALGAVSYFVTCNNPTEQAAEHRARCDVSPTEMFEQPTMNIEHQSRYKPAVYIGPMISDANDKECPGSIPAPEKRRHDGRFYF